MIDEATEGSDVNANGRAWQLLSVAAAGQLLDAVEVLRDTTDYRPTSVLRGLATQNSSTLIPRRLRRLLDTTAGVVAIQTLNVVAPVLVFTSGGRRPQLIAASALSLAANKLFEVRNPYGRDGSDQMQGVIHAYRIATALVPDEQRSDDLFLRAVNAQLCVSYLTSGLAKIISGTWRSGDAMALILRTNLYGGTWLSRFVDSRPWAGKTLTWVTIGWECAFPVVYVMDPRTASRALILVKLFHLGISQSMGLPRFLWAFGAAHSAAEHVLSRRGHRAI